MRLLFWLIFWWIPFTGIVVIEVLKNLGVAK